MSTPSSSSTTSTDKTVGAGLAGATCARGATGVRSVAARLRTTEQLPLDVRVLRGSRTVTQRSIAALGSGVRTVRVPIGRNVRGGRTTLQIVARDASSNRKVLCTLMRLSARA